MTQHDLAWLRDQRPETPAPDAAATARARAALLEHATRPHAPRIPASAPPRRRPRRAAALVALAAVGLTGVVFASPVGESVTDGGSLASRVFGPTEAQAAPLVRLAERLHAQVAPTGDATLVIERRGKEDATGLPSGEAELYLDDGRAVWAGSEAALRETKGLRADPEYQRDQELTQRRTRAILGAAAAVADPAIPLPAARERMLRAWGEKGLEPRLADNRIWVAGYDAILNGGAGRPEVRAGVLRLFSSIAEVEIERARIGNRDVLEIVSKNLPGAVETLVIDARTGVPIRFESGDGGGTAVSMEYEVRRVDAADVLGG